MTYLMSWVEMVTIKFKDIRVLERWMPSSYGYNNDPEKRVLLRVTMDEEESSEIDLTFTTLMGDKVEPRREFIEENARYVRNLDV